ncbi:MAG: ATP-binding protein, partial [Methanobacterium sp.]
SELVSNSLKYAFPPNIRDFEEEKGEIFVGLKSVGDFIQLRIYDNGIGFPEGRDYNNLDTLGLRLVNVLVNQIDGQIELDNSDGVDFKVKFKELEYKERF